MDILSHTFSGMAVGTVAMQFSKGGFKHKSLILFVSTLGGFIPDLDAVSYWSGFDSTIGNFFDLKRSGSQIYHSKSWYAHHAFNHSLMGAFVYSFILSLVLCYSNKYRKKGLSFSRNYLTVIGFFMGFMAHVFEDMPTPEFAWGGVALFFPSENYTGGTGLIWWWNNYDLFLIIIAVVITNLICSAVGYIMKKKVALIAVLTFVIGLSCYLIQINSRQFDFQYSGFQGHNNVWHVYEAKSKTLQKSILGDALYEIMEDFDNQLPFYF